MARKTLREIARIYAEAKALDPLAAAGLRAVAVGTNQSLKMVATITIAGVAYEIAGDTGKVKTFQDVDDVLKFAAKAAEKGDGIYTIEVDTGELFASSVPNDIVKAAESSVVRLNKTKQNQNAVIAAIDVDLGFMTGWESGNAAQQAKKAETLAQRACVVTDIAAIDTEIARLTLIVAP